MPFGELGTFFLAFRDSIFAPWEHLGRPFWHLGSTLGSHFGVSEAHWEAILAPRDHLGGPWEQQDGHEVENNRILVSFWVSKCVKILFIFRLVSRSFFDRFLTRISDVLDFKIVVCARMQEGIARNGISWKSFSKNFRIDF